MIENLSRSERLEQEDLLDYKDLTPPVDDRVVDLLNHMTLEGEVAQMLFVRQNKTLLDDQGDLDFEKPKEHYEQGYELGGIGRRNVMWTRTRTPEKWLDLP